MSLKVIESGTIWKLGYGFLFAFHSNYGRIFSHFADIHRQRMCPILKSGFGVVQFHWKWRGSTDHVWLPILPNCNYSSILYRFRVNLTLNIIVTLKCGLEVTQDHWNWCHSKAWVRFLFVFYSNYGHICSRLWDIWRQRVVWPWKQG